MKQEKRKNNSVKPTLDGVAMESSAANEASSKASKAQEISLSNDEEISQSQAIPLSNGQELFKSNGQAISQSNVKEISQSNGQSISQSNGKEISQSNGLEISQSRGREISFSNGQEISQSNGQKLFKSNGQAISKFNCKEISQSNGQEISQSNGQDISQYNGLEISQSNGQGISQSSGHEITQSNGQEITQSNGQEISQSNGLKISQSNGLKISDSNDQEIYQSSKVSSNADVSKAHKTTNNSKRIDVSKESKDKDHSKADENVTKSTDLNLPNGNSTEHSTATKTATATTSNSTPGDKEGLVNQTGCFLCGIKTDNRCPDCGIFACPKHLPLHKGRNRKTDKEMLCLPYRVIWREDVGRCVVATRDIKPLELIIQDEAVVIGPQYEAEATCVQCLGRVDGSVVCDACNFLFCTEECKQTFNSTKELGCQKTGSWHGVECEVFRKLEPKLEVTNTSPGTIAYEYGGISVLRLLSLRDADPDSWARLQFLMDHEQERREEKEFWRMFQVNVVDFLRKRCNLADKYSDEEIHWAIGILRTNAANVNRKHMQQQGTSGKSIYPTFSFLSHSCVCNARYIIDPKDDSMDVRAQTHIKKGEEITIQYITFLFGNVKRRKDIKASWMFECGCRRCRDVTELNTFLSALLCPKCGGPVLPKSSELKEKDWECRECGESVPTETVEDISDQLEKTMFDTFEDDTAKYEALIEEYTPLLHPNHFQMLLLKRYLADSMEKSRYLAETMNGRLSLEQIKRKIGLMEEYLNTFRTVDPGYSKWFGKLQFHICRTKLFLADIQHSNNLIDREEFVRVLKQNISDLTEVVASLEYEPEGSVEVVVRIRSQQALAQAKDILLFASMGL